MQVASSSSARCSDNTVAHVQQQRQRRRIGHHRTCIIARPSVLCPIGFLVSCCWIISLDLRVAWLGLCRRSVSISRRAAGVIDVSDDKWQDADSMPRVEAAGSIPRVEATGLSTNVIAEVEVVNVQGSRAAKLVFSKEVQTFVTTYIKLHDLPGGNGELVFTGTISNLLTEVELVLLGSKEVPEDLVSDRQQFQACLSLPEARTVSELMHDIASTNLAKRLPEAIDALDWVSIFDYDEFNLGVTQDELRNGLKSLASIDLSELLTWSADDLDEALDLVKRNEAMSILYDGYEAAKEWKMKMFRMVVAGFAVVAGVILYFLPIVRDFVLSGATS